MLQNIKLVVMYDGNAYRGWQKTPMGPSIESTLQSRLEQILQHPITLQAASRTDAGVHAQGQIVNFFTSKDCNLDKLRLSLNQLLPSDIVILSAHSMHASFHPTLDCLGKEYRYYICYGDVQVPHYRYYSWHFPADLNLEEMRQGASSFVGLHDFSAFCNFKKNATYTDFKREIKEIEIMEIESKRLCIRVKGNHFLYKMVRNLVGTLSYVGKGKIKKESLPLIIQSNDRKQSGVTAPAHGLFLHQVFYNFL